MVTTLGLRERKKLDTRRALSDAALQLMFERGIDSVTREAIADLAGVSLRTFSNYFTGKYEAVAYRQAERVRRSVAEGDQEKPRRSGTRAGGLFGRCDVLHRWSFGFDFLAVFIGLVQKPIDQAGAAFLPRIFGLLPVVKVFVIPTVAHGRPPFEGRTNRRATLP